MPLIPSRIAALRALCLILAAGGSVGAAIATVDRVEADGVAAVRAALGAAGLGRGVSVAADGTLATIAGEVPDEATRFKVLAAAGDALDPARLRDAMRVPPPESLPRPAYRVEMLRNGGEMTVHGLVPGGVEGKAALTRRLGRLDAGSAAEPGRGGTLAVSDLLTAVAGAAPEAWAGTLAAGVTAVAGLPTARVVVTPQKLFVEGLAPGREAARRLQSDLRAAMPGGVALEVSLRQPRPVLSPYILRFRLDAAGARFDACAAETPADRARIEAAALAVAERAAAPADAEPADTAVAFGSVEPDRLVCAEAMGAPDPNWAGVATAAIRAVEEMGGGTVTISDLTVTLEPPQATDPAALSAAIGLVEAGLPDLFTLVVPAAAPAEGDAGADPAEAVFAISRSEAGEVTLAGPVGDVRTQEMIRSFAGASLGGGDIAAELQLRPNLPQDWSLRVLAALDALSHLTHGTARVTPAFLEVAGVTGDPEGRAAASAALSEALGPSGVYRLDISYDQAFDPVAALPTPEECVAGVEAAIDGRKIAFAPGSVDLDSEGLAIVADVARVLRDCPEAQIEIGGHTDSQGREEMNARLSQQRADAVLNALVARRILTGNLTARGYGEAAPVADNGTEAGREANRRIAFALREARAEATAPDPAAAAPGETPVNEPNAQPDNAPGDAPDAAADAGTEGAGWNGLSSSPRRRSCSLAPTCWAFSRTGWSPACRGCRAPRSTSSTAWPPICMRRKMPATPRKALWPRPRRGLAPGWFRPRPSCARRWRACARPAPRPRISAASSPKRTCAAADPGASPLKIARPLCLSNIPGRSGGAGPSGACAQSCPHRASEASSRASAATQSARSPRHSRFQNGARDFR